MSTTVAKDQSQRSSTAPPELGLSKENIDFEQTQSSSQKDPQSQHQSQPQTHTFHHQPSHHIQSRKTPAELEAQKETDSRSIYIGNVDYDSTPDEIENFFKKVGPVNRVTIILNKYTGYPKGYAYVEFEKGEDSLKAIKLFNSSTFKDRVITVVAKRTNLPGFKSPRGGRGGSYRGRGGQRGGYRGGHYRGNGYRGGYRGGRGGYNNYHTNNNQSNQNQNQNNNNNDDNNNNINNDNNNNNNVNVNATANTNANNERKIENESK